MKRLLMALLLCAATPIAAPGNAYAQDDASEEAEEASDYQTLTAKATEAYENGEYDKAIVLFERAYEVRPVSNILYNIGRIYEDAGNIDKAIEYYDKFVVAPNVEQTARKDALERLKTLREVKAMRDGEQVAEKGTQDAQPDTTPQPQPQPQADAGPSTGRTVGWVFVGVGGASLVGAGVFGLLTQSAFNNFQNASTLGDRRAASTAGETNALIADSLLVAGIVTGVVGAVFLVASGDGEKAQASKLRVGPAVGRKSVGLSLGLDF